MFAVTAFYASILAIIFVFLSRNTIVVRWSTKIPIGDGGDPMLLRRMRVHGNFAEYVPFALLLIGLAEGQGAPVTLLHTLGVVLVVGRIVHAVGVSREPENFRYRVAGMTATFMVIAVAAIINLSQSAGSWLIP